MKTLYYEEIGVNGIAMEMGDRVGVKYMPVNVMLYTSAM